MTAREMFDDLRPKCNEFMCQFEYPEYMDADLQAASFSDVVSWLLGEAAWSLPIWAESTKRYYADNPELQGNDETEIEQDKRLRILGICLDMIIEMEEMYQQYTWINGELKEWKHQNQKLS